jgi:hypothetical protein
MPCGCGKKKTSGYFLDKNEKVEPEIWGPIVWKYLHCLTEKISINGNPIITADQIKYTEVLLSTLHTILPCTECQAHASLYISQNPVPSLKDLKGEQLRSVIRTWIFTFHNSVRIRKNQPILVNSPEECIGIYRNCSIPKCEYNTLIRSVAYAARQGWVRIDNWKRWYTHSERIRLITDNFITN